MAKNDYVAELVHNMPWTQPPTNTKAWYECVVDSLRADVAISDMFVRLDASATIYVAVMQSKIESNLEGSIE